MAIGLKIVVPKSRRGFEMYGGIGRGITELMVLMIWGLVISVPLAIWKLVEIVIWLFNHVSISWT